MLQRIDEIGRLAERAVARVRELEEERARLQAELESARKIAEEKELEVLLLKEEQEKTMAARVAEDDALRGERVAAEERLEQILERFRSLSFEGTPNV